MLTGESALLGHQFSPEGIWEWTVVAQDQLRAQTETVRILSPGVSWLLCPGGSGWVPLAGEL